jgi:hypothetical protein
MAIDLHALLASGQASDPDFELGLNPPDFDLLDELPLEQAASWHCYPEESEELQLVTLAEAMELEPYYARSFLDAHLAAIAVARRALDFQHGQIADGVRVEEALARCQQIGAWLALVLADAVSGAKTYPQALLAGDRDDSYKLAGVTPIARATVFPH